MPLSNEQRDKYFHSTFLKEIKEEGQIKLLNSHVAVIGCGGLASSLLIHLTSMGVGNITIIDDDKVSLSNLPRQTIFTKKDIGLYKVDVSKKKLEALNNDVSIKSVKERLNESNGHKLLKGFDIVIDCTDNFETKFLIDDLCHELNIPFVTAGVSDYQGQVCTCIPSKSKGFKSLFSVLPINIDEKYKEEDQGVFPPSIGVISEIACSEAIKYLLGIGSLLLDQLLVVNLLTNKAQLIKFPK